MNSLAAITTFFGWTTVINFVLLAFTTVSILAMRGWMSRMHARIFRLEPADVLRGYYQYIAQYKIAIIVFSLTPYVALKLMA